jgi:peroxiredoxin family protein
MVDNLKGLGIIFHSGSFDRIYNGLSIAATALALEQDVKFFFTYWSLSYLKKDQPSEIILDKEAEEHRLILEKAINKGQIQEFSNLLSLSKEMGAKVYACSGSLAIRNIKNEDLIEDVDKVMGLATFLTDIEDYQVLFI